MKRHNAVPKVMEGFKDNTKAPAGNCNCRDVQSNLLVCRLSCRGMGQGTRNWNRTVAEQ